ncbi:MAG TPA: acetoacetate decarboxylase family protein [Rectinema sp.]|jgi:acetoacetate decarboxylase|nr:acetoacetate decarboxylase family protein [Rectinema sp.]HOO02887.1 acetoacetate decarboxylase family protein [Rectinema sp.]HOU61338.1 acetoacetate decarboxylase family protein [Rectinema sp.]HPD70017.1 acetoacetate decarboxylase family protein [Rectinema sp.]HPG96884.1 acetoacetate decarboxylase family protein [Rectinema sp.]
MFKFEEGKCYKMPAHFGGSYFDPDAKAIYDDVVTLIFSYTTDGEQLSNYVPEGFELTKPELSIEFQQCRQVEWMAGSYYDLVSVAAPVRFNGQRDRLEGSFSLVVWENKTTPILTGNMMGVPKIYADIEDLHILADTYRTRLSFEGSTFLELEMIRHQPLDAEEVKAMNTDINSLGWRYIPKVGAPGADLSQPILFPMHNEPNSAWLGSGKVKWTKSTWDQNPMQFYIINALAELPIIDMKPVILTQGREILTEAQGRVLK